MITIMKRNGIKKLVILSVFYLSMDLYSNAQSGQPYLFGYYHCQNLIISPDAKWYVTVREIEIDLWKTDDQALVNVFLYPEGIRDIQFSPDSKLLIVRSQTKLCIHQVPYGKLVHEEPITNNSYPYDSMFFSSDGKTYLTSYHNDLKCRLWSTTTGELIQEYGPHESFMGDVAITNNNTNLISMTSDHMYNLWDIKTGNWISSLPLLFYDVLIEYKENNPAGDQPTFTRCFLSPDGNKAITVWNDYYRFPLLAFVENIKAHELIVPIEYDTNNYYLRFSKNSEFVYSTRGVFKLWDLNKKVLSKDYYNKGLLYTMEQADIDYKMEKLLFLEEMDFMNPKDSDLTQIIKVFGLSNDREISRNYAFSPKQIFWADFTPSGKEVAYTANNNLIFYDRDTRKIRKIGDCPAGFFTFFPNHERQVLVIESIYKHIDVFDLNQNVATQTIYTSGPVEPSSIHISNDESKAIVTGASYPIVYCYDLKSGELLYKFQDRDVPINTAIFSSDDRQIITASCDYSIRLWDAGSGKMEGIFATVDSDPQSLSQSKDGAFLLIGQTNRTASLYRFKSKTFVRSFAGSSPQAALSPDGQKVLVGNYLWETGSNESATILEEPANTNWSNYPFRYVKFAADNRSALALRDGKRVIVWNIEKESAVTGWINETQ